MLTMGEHGARGDRALHWLACPLTAPFRKDVHTPLYSLFTGYCSPRVPCPTGPPFPSLPSPPLLLELSPP